MQHNLHTPSSPTAGSSHSGTFSCSLHLRLPCNCMYHACCSLQTMLNVGCFVCQCFRLSCDNSHTWIYQQVWLPKNGVSIASCGFTLWNHNDNLTIQHLKTDWVVHTAMLQKWQSMVVVTYLPCVTGFRVYCCQVTYLPCVTVLVTRAAAGHQIPTPLHWRCPAKAVEGSGEMTTNCSNT